MPKNDTKKHLGSDNNGQSTSDVHGGELKNGRLSQFKNHNAKDEDVPNEYLNNKLDYIDRH